MSPQSIVAPMTTAPRVDEVAVIPRRHWIRLAIVFLFLGAAALWYSPRADPLAWWVHGVWCLTGLAFVLPTMSRAFRHGFALTMTDHRLMFVSSFALYFLFGAALPAFGPEIQAAAAMAHFPIDVRQALRVDGVNGLGFGIALLAAAFSKGRWLGRQAGRVAGHVSRLPANWVITFLLLSGSVASYMVLSFDSGARIGIVPGSLRSAAQLVLVAIFLSASRSGRGERALRFSGTLVALALSFANALQFNKSGALLPLASLIAGLALRFNSRRILPLGLAVLIFGFVALGNITNVARIETFGGKVLSQADRWESLKDAWAMRDELYEEEEYSYWGRLCYVPTAAAGLSFWDQGNGGDGLELMWWVAVPRFLAPQKPEITRTSRELYEKITGNNTSADGQGIFASGYYHGGWWGLLLASALCGWVVAQTSAIARVIHERQALLMLPLSLLGLFIAFRIDGDFVPDYLGAFMFILYPVLAAALVLRVLGSAPRREVGSS